MTAAGGSWWEPTNVDCRVVMPPVVVTDMVKVGGCRNVTVIGGEIHKQVDTNGPAELPGLFLQNYTGTAHAEGIRIRGPGFSDGVWASSSAPAATAQLENVLVSGLAASEEPTSGFVSGWPAEHPDCLQLWAGPKHVRVDRFSCYTPYAGVDADTASQGAALVADELRISHTDVHLDERSPNGRQCFAAWVTAADGLPAMTSLDQAWCATGTQTLDSALRPRPSADPTWWGPAAGDGGVRAGAPPGGTFVGADDAGLGYRSPGYASARTTDRGPGTGVR